MSKKVRIIVAAISCCIAALAVADNVKVDSPEKYIAAYSPIAVSEMHRTGVPASITLAQGLLESGFGQSKLATEGNNHFGIKCHKNWTGKSMRADDDAPNECFRAYDKAEDSYRDHSDFLRYSDRYKFLFEYNLTDYESWAYGLKKAGYATDSNYPKKLIGYIEKYNLSRFDSMTVPQVQQEVKESGILPDNYFDDFTDLYNGSDIPDSPLRMERPTRLSEAHEMYSFPLSRTLYSMNGVPFIVSVEGESYESIAKEFELFKKEILRFNDLKASEPLLPGTVVYLQAKKTKAAKGVDKYYASADGEQLRDIAQRYAVKLSSLKKMNGNLTDETLSEGQEILLRPLK